MVFAASLRWVYFPDPAPPWEPDSPAPSYTWASTVRASPPGTMQPPQGGGPRQGPGGHPVTQPGRAQSSVLPSGLMEGVFRGQHSRDTRRSLEREEGTHRPAQKVTGPGSQLQSSAPHVGSPGPAAGPHSAEWQSRGRRHTGCAGRSRSPRRSARSQRLQAPEATTGQSRTCPHPLVPLSLNGTMGLAGGLQEGGHGFCAQLSDGNLSIS